MNFFKRRPVTVTRQISVEEGFDPIETLNELREELEKKNNDLQKAQVEIHEAKREIYDLRKSLTKLSEFKEILLTCAKRNDFHFIEHELKRELLLRESQTPQPNFISISGAAGPIYSSSLILSRD